MSKLSKAANRAKNSRGHSAPSYPTLKKSGRPLLTSSGAVFKYSKGLAKKFSFVDRFNEPYTTYKVLNAGSSKEKIMLPRAKFPLGEKDKRISGEAIDVELKMPPRPKQESVCQEMVEHYKTPSTGLIINASTGFGKTYLGCVAIDQVKRTTLVLIPKSDLEIQWRNSLKTFLGLDDSDIGSIKGDVCDVIGKKVVIGYVQSLMKDQRYKSWVYKYFGMLIADEVHLMAADKFSNCMFLVPAKYRLGLSATLDRGDQKEHIIKDHIGRSIITAEQLPMSFNVSVVATDITVPKHIHFSPGRIMSLNNFLGAHVQRQALITAKIRKAYESDRHIVCFADTKKHLEYAYDCLVDDGLPINDIGFYVGMKKTKNPEADAKKLEEQALKRIVLATYKMTAFGTDYPQWDTAMLMTPRSDVRQIVGRVTRELEGKKTPLVFDVVDPVWLLEGYFSSRNRWYKKHALKVVGLKKVA